MRLLTDELALQLTESLLQNDKNIKDDLQAKLDAFDITVSRTADDKGVVITIADGNETNSATIYDGTGTDDITMVKAIL